MKTRTETKRCQISSKDQPKAPLLSSNAPEQWATYLKELLRIASLTKDALQIVSFLVDGCVLSATVKPASFEKKKWIGTEVLGQISKWDWKRTIVLQRMSTGISYKQSDRWKHTIRYRTVYPPLDSDTGIDVYDWLLTLAQHHSIEDTQTLTINGSTKTRSKTCQVVCTTGRDGFNDLRFLVDKEDSSGDLLTTYETIDHMFKEITMATITRTSVGSKKHHVLERLVDPDVLEQPEPIVFERSRPDAPPCRQWTARWTNNGNDDGDVYGDRNGDGENHKSSDNSTVMNRFLTENATALDDDHYLFVTAVGSTEVDRESKSKGKEQDEVALRAKLTWIVQRDKDLERIASDYKENSDGDNGDHRKPKVDIEPRTKWIFTLPAPNPVCVGGSESVCVKLVVDVTPSIITGKLELLSATGSCALALQPLDVGVDVNGVGGDGSTPRGGGGSRLLDHVIAVAHFFGVEHLTVDDAALLWCPGRSDMDPYDPNGSVTLRTFSLIVDGKTWYQKHGFQVIEDESRPPSPNMESELDTRRNEPMKAWLSQVESALDFKQHSSAEDKEYQTIIIGLINKKPKERLKIFLRDLYQTDCQSAAWLINSVIENDDFFKFYNEITSQLELFCKPDAISTTIFSPSV